MLSSPPSARKGGVVRVDRVEEDIYVFVSSLYAQVTATVMLTPQGAVIVDTMPFPAESREISAFIEEHLGPDAVRYIINTHHHADHVFGNYLFPSAEVIAHDLCRQMMERSGRAGLARAKRESPALAEVELRLPDMTFQRQMHLRVGHRHMRLFHTPGHTPDALSVFVLGDKVLIAGDTVMPVPYIVSGSVDQMRRALLSLKAVKPDFLVQGHGDVLLRGEVDETIDAGLTYLDCAVRQVSDLVARGAPPEAVREIDIESCGLSRIPLDGLVTRLHAENLAALYREIRGKQAGAERAG